METTDSDSASHHSAHRDEKGIKTKIAKIRIVNVVRDTRVVHNINMHWK